jgi:hypothetical protein
VCKTSEKDAVLETLTVISTQNGSNSDLSASAELVIGQLTKPQPDKDKEDEVVENLAENLPKVSAGILAAITAFRKGDDLTGAAEIMKTCGAMASLIGSLTATGGPPGMLVGAIFSMIGQIIAFFQPAKESDVDRIKAFLLSIEAEGKKQQADADLLSIRHATKGMRKQAKETAKALKKFNDFQVLPLVKAVLAAFHAVGGGTEDLTPWNDVMAARVFSHKDFIAFWEALEWRNCTLVASSSLMGPQSCSIGEWPAGSRTRTTMTGTSGLKSCACFATRGPICLLLI